MSLPTFITHYYEADHGPFLNICDLDEGQIQTLTEREKAANTAFNRFAMGPDFFKWRRAADDPLVRSYTEKFGFPPAGRPFYALLGVFDKTLTMFRDGRKVVLETGDFQRHELTFMYPDHAHLVSLHDSDAPRLFYQPPPGMEHLKFWGKLFTYDELCAGYSEFGIDSMIGMHHERDGWAGCYVEAHIWRRELRDQWCEDNSPAQSGGVSQG